MISNTDEKRIYRIILYFVTYAFIGWLYEVGLCIFEAKIGFVNRGFLWLPILPVYGFGSLFFLQLYKLRNKKFLILGYDFMHIAMFFIIVIFTTIIELITSYAMEAMIGRWLWDYTGYFMNFEGRIALKPSLRFGIGGMIILYFVHPLLRKFIHLTDKRILKILSIISVFAIAIDLLFRLKYGSNFQG